MVIHIATDSSWVFIIVMTLSLGSSLFTIRYLSGLESDIGDLYENDIKGQTYAQNAYATLIGIESSVKDLVIADSDDARAASAAGLRSASESLRSLVLKATPTLNSARYRTLIAKSKRDMNAFVDALQRRMESGSSDAPGASAGRAFLSEIEPRATALRVDLQRLNDIKRGSNRDSVRALRIQLRLSLAISIAILLVSIAVRVFMYRASRNSVKSAPTAEDGLRSEDGKT